MAQEDRDFELFSRNFLASGGNGSSGDANMAGMSRDDTESHRAALASAVASPNVSAADRARLQGDPNNAALQVVVAVKPKEKMWSRRMKKEQLKESLYTLATIAASCSIYSAPHGGLGDLKKKLAHQMNRIYSEVFEPVTPDQCYNKLQSELINAFARKEKEEEKKTGVDNIPPPH